MVVTEDTSGEIGARDRNRQASVDAPLFEKRELPTTTRAVAVSGRRCGESQTRTLPVLPWELIAIIFECAARYDKDSAASLSLVSHSARVVVLPLLFRTIVLQTRTVVHALSQFLRTHPHIAIHVRELWMRQSIIVDAALLVPCVKLERLALTPACLGAFCSSGRRCSTSSLNASGKVEAERTLMCTPYELLLFPGHVRWEDLDFGAWGGMRSFSPSLTHLRLTRASQLQMLLECNYACDGLSHLTHLAAPSVLPLRTTVADILKIFHSLRMFVITPQVGHGFQHNWYRNLSMEDGRTSISYARYVHDERVHLLDANGQKKEESIFVAWKESEFDIWNCTATHSNCGGLFVVDE